MDLVLITQIVFLFVIFGLCFMCVLLPLKIVPRDSKEISVKSARILSYCNCFSGGVFLGTCFLQLIPFIEDKFNYAFYHYGVNLMYTSPVTMVLVMMGFFLILLIEQIVRVCQNDNPGDDMLQMVAVPIDYSASDAEDTDDSDGQDSCENKGMLKKVKHRNSTGVRNGSLDLQTLEGNTEEIHNKVTHSHSPYDHGHNHGHSHGGHGHSHLTDIIKDDFGLRCILLLLALSVHSLFEGIALGLQDELYKAITLFIGVAVHEILVAFAIGVNLAQQKLQLSTIVKMCLFFSLTIPVGMAIGMVVRGFTSLTSQIISASVQGITAGTFVYVTFLEILPAEINSPKNRLLKVFFIFLGFVMIACLKFGIKDDDGSESYYQPKWNAGS